MNLGMVKEGKAAINPRNGDYPATLTRPVATLSRSRGRGVRLLPGEGEVVCALGVMTGGWVCEPHHPQTSKSPTLPVRLFLRGHKSS